MSKRFKVGELRAWAITLRRLLNNPKAARRLLGASYKLARWRAAMRRHVLHAGRGATHGYAAMVAMVCF